jgi:predicted RNA-binding protein with PUA domain
MLVVEHISNLWELQEESHILENKMPDEAQADEALAVLQGSHWLSNFRQWRSKI